MGSQWSTQAIRELQQSSLDKRQASQPTRSCRASWKLEVQFEDSPEGAPWYGRQSECPASLRSSASDWRHPSYLEIRTTHKHSCMRSSNAYGSQGGLYYTRVTRPIRSCRSSILGKIFAKTGVHISSGNEPIIDSNHYPHETQLFPCFYIPPNIKIIMSVPIIIVILCLGTFHLSVLQPIQSLLQPRIPSRLAPALLSLPHDTPDRTPSLELPVLGNQLLASAHALRPLHRSE